MELILNAIMLVITTLVAVPDVAANLDTVRKTKLGKAMRRLVGRIDIIVGTGHRIIATIERLALLESAGSGEEFRAEADRLRDLLRRQLTQVRDLSHALYSDEERDSGVYSRDSVIAVLKLYAPTSAHTLSVLTSGKTNILTLLAREFMTWTEFLKLNYIVVKEITYVDAGRIAYTYGLEEPERMSEAIREGWIAVREYNLGDPEQRNAYLSGAKARLSNISESRDQLVELIKAHWEPHQII